MRIRYLSDLHLEFIKPHKLDEFIEKIPPGPDEICVLAGDIGYPCSSNYDKFMTHISNIFRKVFVIAGNHEYYNKKQTIIQLNIFLEEYFCKFDNISFLNNKYEIYENYCFAGTTLWSKITNPNYEINDTKSILNYDYIQCNNLNNMCINFLESVVNVNDNCIIITHHIPSESLIDDQFRNFESLPYNQWFYSDMDEFIEKYKNKIKCWIYGHTHKPSDNIINDIPFICNPVGYPNENSNTNFQKCITLP